jgi:hypothetical protein
VAEAEGVLSGIGVSSATGIVEGSALGSGVATTGVAVGVASATGVGTGSGEASAARWFCQ